MDAVNVSQLTNAAGNVYNALNSLSNSIGDVMIINVANYNLLINLLDDTYVNTAGDTMTGPLTINNNLIVNGELFAVTSKFVNIVVSNSALIATNLTLQGVLDMGGNQITNLGPATRGDMAVNLDQLTNAMQQTQKRWICRRRMTTPTASPPRRAKAMSTSVAPRLST